MLKCCYGICRLPASTVEFQYSASVTEPWPICFNEISEASKVCMTREARFCVQTNKTQNIFPKNKKPAVQSWLLCKMDAVLTHHVSSEHVSVAFTPTVSKVHEPPVKRCSTVRFLWPDVELSAYFTCFSEDNRQRTCAESQFHFVIMKQAAYHLNTELIWCCSPKSCTKELEETCSFWSLSHFVLYFAAYYRGFCLFPFMQQQWFMF